MRILGSRGVPARHGGFETLAERLQQEFTSMGIHCDVVGTRGEQSKNSFFGRIVQHRLFHSLETPLLTWTSRHQDTRASPDRAVLVVNPINVLTAMALQRSGDHVALHMDGMEDQRSKWGYFARVMHRTARRIAIWSNLVLVTDSRAIQAWYLTTFGRETEMIAYGGCVAAESDKSHRWAINSSSDFFMVVARSEPENQIFEICQAFINSSSPHRLIVVGAPIGPNKYWGQVTDLVGNQPNIELAGSIWDRQRLCEMYRSTLGVIHGHTVGGTNPALVDALSHGSPMIAHNNPFNREVLDGHGLLWRTVDELTAILNIHDPKKFSVDVNMFLTRYNWTTVAQQYVRLMQLETSRD
jgi:hypothetical protein